jgi:murein DD-endopeptidase MepM/ murein hydrolase activator NlpD
MSGRLHHPLTIAARPALEHNSRMDNPSAALACVGRVVGGLALLLMASCASYEVREQPAGVALPQPVPRPTAAISAAPLPPVESELSAGDTVPTREPGVHRARSGETAYSVARRYGVDAYAVISANNLIPPFDLYEGQRLVIPGTSAHPASAAAAPPAPQPSNQQPTARATGAPADAAGQTTALARPNAPRRETGSFEWPVEGSVISEFGPKGGGRYNDGINIAAPMGTPVRAAQSGVVAYAGNEVRGFGNMLLLKHPNGWVTAYAHNQELLVQRGERVRRGQVIARVGSSGSVDRPQLHFEVRQGKQAVDPMRELSRPSAEARERDSG